MGFIILDKCQPTGNSRHYFKGVLLTVGLSLDNPLSYGRLVGEMWQHSHVGSHQKSVVVLGEDVWRKTKQHTIVDSMFDWYTWKTWRVALRNVVFFFFVLFWRKCRRDSHQLEGCYPGIQLESNQYLDKSSSWYCSPHLDTVPMDLI